jgi:branched-chain amino acid transport system permease protein
MPISLFYFLIFTGIFILLGWAIYIVYRNGQLNNVPIAAMAVGAYICAYLTRELHWPFFPALLAAMGGGAIFSFVPALGLGRAPGFSMTIATIAMIFITQTVLRNMAFLGGVYGFYSIPRVDHLLIVTYVIVFIVGFFIFRLERSRIGRAMEVVFIDTSVARTLKINTYWLSVWLQVFAGVLGAIAGVLFANLVRILVPRHFSLGMLLNIYCFMFVGGYTTMWGVVVFTPILWGFPLLLPEVVAEWKDSIYGLLLVVTMLLRPEGVITKKMLWNIAISVKRYFISKKKR